MTLTLKAASSKWTEYSGLWDARKELEEKLEEVKREIADREREDPALRAFRKQFLKPTGAGAFLEESAEGSSPKKRKREEAGDRERMEKELRKKKLQDWNRMVQKEKAGKPVPDELLALGVPGGMETGKPISEALLIRWIGDSKSRKKKVDAYRYAGSLDADMDEEEG